MQFWCTGTSRPHVAFLDTLSQDLVVEGRVHVRDTLQLQGFDHIFCPGDVNDTAGPKLAYTARWQGQHVAASIIRLIQHKPVSAYCSLLPTGLVVVPLGKSSGVTYVPYAGNWGSWLTWLVKGRDLFLPSTWRDLKLAPP
jgi:NADH dehydrogenase FAD-containing subunit